VQQNERKGLGFKPSLLATDMSSSSSSSESEFESQKEKAVSAGSAGKGRQLSRMTPAERSAMIEWLDMDREGQKEGQSIRCTQTLNATFCNKPKSADQSANLETKKSFASVYTS
jgi:hypothetical protein